MPAPKRQHRPRIDAVIRHIRLGSYDDEMGQLQGAIADRQQIRQKAVMDLVKEVYGHDFTVATATEEIELPATERPNPFLPPDKGAELDPEWKEAEARARAEEERLQSQLGGDYESRSPIIGAIPSADPQDPHH
jgi:hypothetical protein